LSRLQKLFEEQGVAIQRALNTPFRSLRLLLLFLSQFVSAFKDGKYSDACEYLKQYSKDRIFFHLIIFSVGHRIYNIEDVSFGAQTINWLDERDPANMIAD
jgi:hypothetical protein